jgi:5-methylcytosine-specific restriction endonuclease McrBC GTP-binding regulatory subunit McrB
VEGFQGEPTREPVTVQRSAPYFLILDEMNLSHVERYFAGFLSAMESGQEIVLHGGSGDSVRIRR